MARQTRELTDAQWAALQPLLPPQRPRTGRPNKDHRLILEAIVWLDRTGAPWRDLPREYGPWKTVASRFYRWRRHGVFDHLLAETQQLADAAGKLDWLTHFADGSVVRAHQHAAGARHQPAKQDRKGIAHAQDEALGRSRGGLSTKLHLRTEGGGKPLVILATAGQRHEVTQLGRLLDQGAVKRTSAGGRPGRGRPRRRPAALAGDKGYSYPSVRAELRRRGIRAVIPTKSNQPRLRGFDRMAYRARNQVERSVGRLKQFRRVATRYEKRG
jgi:transposase